MKIAIGSDHGGFLLKQKLIKFLESKGHVVADVGTHSRQPADYPVYGAKAARLVASGQFDRGIVICKTGLGMSMTANKIPGIRAGLCWDLAGARSSRRHNNANVLAIGANKVTFNLAKRITGAWLKTEFEGGRHARRVRQMKRLES